MLVRYGRVGENNAVRATATKMYQGLWRRGGGGEDGGEEGGVDVSFLPGFCCWRRSSTSCWAARVSAAVSFASYKEDGTALGPRQANYIRVEGPAARLLWASKVDQT